MPRPLASNHPLPTQRLDSGGIVAQFAQQIVGVGAEHGPRAGGWWVAGAADGGGEHAEGDSVLTSVRTVRIILPLSEVKRPLEARGLSVRTAIGQATESFMR